MIKIALLLIVLMSSVVFAQESDDECYAYESFGSAYPLSRDQMEMIESLNEAVRNISSPKGSYEKKVRFFQSIMPDVVAALGEVEKERLELMRILSLEEPGAAELKTLEELKAKYDAKTTKELKLKVNIIPIDLILVQSAIESGWGESNAAKQCNNLMGLHAYGGLSVCDTPSRKIASFDSKKKSLETYILSINRNSAYVDFRKKRQEILHERQKFTGVELAPYLLKYSTRGKDYTDEVSKYIRNHQLDDVIASAVQISENCEFPLPAD